MKRLTNVIQIVALVLAAFFVVCLFTSQFPPWKSDSGGGQAAANTTVISAGTTAAGAATTAAGEGAATTAAGEAATTAAASTADGKALYEKNSRDLPRQDRGRRDRAVAEGGPEPILCGRRDLDRHKRAELDARLRR